MKPTAKLTLSNINDLPHIDDIEPLTAIDLECFSEIRDILNKHGLINRFGVSLLHKHFDLDDGEVLIEETCEETRRQLVKPKPISELHNQDVMPTAWRLVEGDSVVMGCYRTCTVPPGGGHNSKHVTAGN